MDDEIVEAAGELDPDADCRLLELTFALSEAVHAADTKDVQQEGTEIHLRFGRWRVRANVTEVVRDATEVVAPPLRNTTLGDKRERQLLQGTIHRLAADAGARVSMNALDLSTLPLESVKVLRKVLQALPKGSDLLEAQQAAEASAGVAQQEKGRNRQLTARLKKRFDKRTASS